MAKPVADAELMTHTHTNGAKRPSIRTSVPQKPVRVVKGVKKVVPKVNSRAPVEPALARSHPDLPHTHTHNPLGSLR